MNHEMLLTFKKGKEKVCVNKLLYRIKIYIFQRKHSKTVGNEWYNRL